MGLLHLNLFALYITLSCTYSMSLPREYKLRKETNRLIPESWNHRYLHYMEEMAENDAFNDYINDLDEYYTHYYEVLELPKFRKPKPNPVHAEHVIDSITSDIDQEMGDITTYLQAPGYTVKMNEVVFRKYLSVLLDLYGINENHEFHDAKQPIEDLRLALKDEARYFYHRPISNLRQSVKKMWHRYKWEIGKAIVVETPLVGYALKLAVSIIENERPAIQRFLNKHWYQRRTRKEYNELQEEVHIGLGEPFPLYILAHWRSPDEDVNSIQNIKIQCPIISQTEVVSPQVPVPDENILSQSPGRCVYRKMLRLVKQVKNEKHVRHSKKCLGLDYDECERQRTIGNEFCFWQFCNCKPWKPFQDVEMLCDMMSCVKKDENECGKSVDCEWTIG